MGKSHDARKMRTSGPPTKRQLVVLKAIHQLSHARGFPPTIRELAETLGITSTNGVSDHPHFLSKKGLVERDAKTARSLRVSVRGLPFVWGTR